MFPSAGVAQFLMERNFPPTSERWYRQKLDAFAEYLTRERVAFEDVTHQHIAAYLRSLQERESEQFHRPLSSKTVHGYARAIKAWVRWAHEEDYLDRDIAKKLRMPKQDETLVDILSAEDIAKLMKACRHEPGWLAERDRTILAVLLDTGIRCSELTGLKLDDVSLGLADSYLQVFGKGRKMRVVPIGKTCRSQLHRYIHKVRPQMEAPWLFPSRRFTKLTVQGVDKLLYRLRDYAGLEGKDIRAHVFRHTMACRFVEQGGDALRLSRILGHTSLQVTSEYLKQFTSRQAMRGALSVLDTL